ncbi:gamma-glutamylcyclotransferase family protein [Aspergillus homomorphus CBS 101889]|uniref:Putative gamma-glutamylcyclotransferase n=1 Tax=Aspergillus homomorphus (strain CBS 101889) TaxID=1450537 RepID=A0A395HNG5_ASPHC|nr:hypothetical protein BO97DRAFT_407728 [Aspergillus homomorphus CBS 101889]RAL09367.1 hypothetical protein BO97DRAFT_407728 [Aspergillus homomorphus CBS 101889]
MSEMPRDAGTLKFPSLSPAKESPPSPFYTMLESAPPDYLTQRDEPGNFSPTFPVYNFFYGTLTDPAQLSRILDLSEEPQLREAEVFGYAVARWGDYPALINSKQGDVVTGRAYLLRSAEEAQKLASYETNAYEVADCWIYFKDGREPAEAGGKVFVYAGDARALLEQRFDRKLWSRQMGRKLG